MHPILENAIETHQLSKSDIIMFLQNDDLQDDLLNAADIVRKKYVGDDVHLRGLIEFSNYCKNDCLYCGLRKSNGKIKRYRLSPNEIVNLANNAAAQGFKTIVMQSGEDLWYTPERMAEILKNIKKNDVAVTLSMGEKTFDEYKEYKDAGADRYLIRIETTDKDLYHRLDPDMSWDDRRRCLFDLKSLGYEVGSGIMVGLPGQSISSIADDLLFLKEIDIDMAGIGPFIAHPDTPLHEEKKDSFDLSLRTMAIMRILLPEINIPATTAMEALRPNGRLIALKAGANVIMPNVSADEFKKLYELYPGKPSVDYSDIAGGIKSIGRVIGSGYGHRPRFDEIVKERLVKTK